VRYGKAAGGGPPQRRTVLLIPEMDWVIPVLEHRLRELNAHHQHPAAPGPRPHEHPLDRLTLGTPPHQGTHGRCTP
jgi:hypothetical protein